MVKVIWQKGRIAAAHGLFNRIHRVAPICTPMQHMLPGAIRAHNPNDIWIGSSIIAQLTAERLYTLQRAWATFLPSKLPLPMGGSGPHLIHDFLGHPVTPQPKWHLDWLSHFCRGHDCDRPIGHTIQSVTTGCIYVRSTAMRPKN